MRPNGLPLTILTVFTLGCGAAAPPAKSAKPIDLTAGGAFHVIELSGQAAYVIDSRAQACFLVLPGRIGAGPVDCHRLKEEVAEARPYVTWEKDDPMADYLSGALKAMDRLNGLGVDNGAPEPQPSPPDVELEGVTKLGPGKWRITREVVKQTLDDPQQFFRAARVVPSIKDGKQNGFKLYAIRPSSLLAAAGFQNGDTVQSVNGNDLHSVERALEVHKQVRGAKRVRVGILRRGKNVIQTYVIK